MIEIEKFKYNLREAVDTGGSKPPVSPPSSTPSGGTANDKENGPADGILGGGSGSNGKSEDRGEDFYKPNLQDIKYFTENPKMSFYGTCIQDFSTQDAKQAREIVQGYANTRYVEELPPGFYDNIKYPHREKILNMVAEAGGNESNSLDRIFVLGDCFFVIPPEFITVGRQTGHEAIQPVRSNGSSYIKHGYASKDIQVNLVLNGMNQINGYEVDSPFNYKYYVDGLRSLISQFKFTPFVPVQNTLLNITNGVYNVALRGLTVETIPGFPEALNVTLSMQQFNAEAHVPSPEDWLLDSIDWDLFRWYVQRPIGINSKYSQGASKINLKKIETGRLTSKFDFKLLNDEALIESREQTETFIKPGDTLKNDDLKIDITNSKYYNSIFSSENNPEITLTYVSFTMGNVMPVIQLSYNESPTMQYLGSCDTTFNLTFEVKGAENAATFERLVTQNLQMVRQNRFTNGIGFIKIENELIQLTGTEFLILTDINTSTVPGFPDLYNVNVQCVSYDSNQSKREKLQAFRPFEGETKGTRDDVWDNSDKGFARKIEQECVAMAKLQDMELYPDLELPKYSTLDSIIDGIRKYREKNNLTPLNIKKYPRHKSIHPGNPVATEYNGYVDPDFYVFYSTDISQYAQSESEPEAIKRTREKALDILNKNGKVEEKDLINLSKSLFDGSIKNPLDFCGPFKKATPHVVTEPDFVPGWEPDMQPKMHRGMLNDGSEKGSGETNTAGAEAGTTDLSGAGSGGTGAGSDPVKVRRRTGNPLVDFCCDRADSGCGYLWGANGQIMTEAVWNNARRTYGASAKEASKKWMGRQVFDCSGFVSWGLSKVGFKPKGWRTTTHGFIAMRNISKNQLRAGDILVTASHAALYIGEGKTVEASNSEKGVVYGELGNRFTHFVRPDGLEACINKFLNENPDIYLPSSSGDSSSREVREVKESKTNNSSRNMARRPTVGNTANNEAAAQSQASSVVLADFGNGDACDKFNPQILQWAKHFNLDPNFIKVIIKIESSGNPNARNGIPCVGLMQVNLNYHKVEGGNPYDPSMNIKKGCEIWDNYRKISYVGTAKDRWLCSYNAGPGYCQSYVRGTKSLPTETKNYIIKYDKYYEQLRANGARAGNTYTPGGPNSGGDSTWQEGISDGESTGVVETPPIAYSYTQDNFKNPNAGKKHGSEISFIKLKSTTSNYTILGKRQAKAPLNQGATSDLSKILPKPKERNQQVEFGILGEPFIEKIGKRKKNAVDIDTGAISKKVQTKNDEKHVLEHMLVDQVQYSAKGTLCRCFPTYLLVFVDEQQQWCDTQKLWSNYYVSRSLVEADVFGDYSNPMSMCKLSLTNFHNNLSTITRPVLTSDMFDDEGDEIRKWFYETTGAIVDEKITDKMINLKNELREEIKLAEGSRIHLRMGYGSDPSRVPTVFNGIITEIQEGEVINIVAESDGRELTLCEVTDKTNVTQEDLNMGEEVSDIITELMVRRENDFLYAFTIGNFGYRQAYGIEHFGFRVHNWLDFNYRQYDINKNLYCGTYEARPACKEPFNPLDGESNFRFVASGKTPWDIMKMCEKAMPEFIAYPRTYGFEHRMFFGLPQWLCKYGYNYDLSTGDVYESAKTFAQLHDVHSLDSIIDNTIRVSSRNHFINAIGVYCLGGDLTTTPVIMSDVNITPEKQSTKILDTSSVQDFGWLPSIVDKLVSWLGAFDNGKNLAIKVCISELIDSWKNTYKGSVLVLGQPEVNVNDYVYIDDLFLNVNGVCTARQVHHSLSVSTGFTTSITPGLCAFNTIQPSGSLNLAKNVLSLCGSIYASKRLASATLATYNQVKATIATYKAYEYFKEAKAIGSVAKNFMIVKGKGILNGVRNADIVKNFVGWVKGIDKLQDTYKTIKGSSWFIKAAKSTKSVISTAKNVTAAASTSLNPLAIAGFVLTIVIDAVISIALGWLLDTFMYRNSISLYPLIRVSPSGKAIWLVSSHQGSKTLLPNDTKQVKDQGFDI